jgi:serine/threonine-protein kinase
MRAAAMAEDAQQGPLGLGEKFLKYSIREIVGKGGHAWVYSGRDDFFDRDVAIKLLHRPGGVTADMLRRGRAEAQLLSRLRHPNVVEVVDAGITDAGQLYIVMELLRGKTLREILRERHRLAPAETLRLFLQIADGVEAAHKLGAIHRDLKPENLFVLDDGTPKI